MLTWPKTPGAERSSPVEAMLWLEPIDQVTMLPMKLKSRRTMKMS